jgi:hypothetical protein
MNKLGMDVFECEDLLFTILELLGDKHLFLLQQVNTSF